MITLNAEQTTFVLFEFITVFPEDRFKPIIEGFLADKNINFNDYSFSDIGAVVAFIESLKACCETLEYYELAHNANVLLGKIEQYINNKEAWVLG